MSFWKSIVPEVNARVYWQDYGRLVPPRPRWSTSNRSMPPAQCDMGFALAAGQFLRYMKDPSYWQPRDPTMKRLPWRDATRHTVELINRLVLDGIVESACATGNGLTVLTGHRESPDWQERVDELCDRVGHTAMVQLELGGWFKVVGYEIIPADNITDPRRFMP